MASVEASQLETAPDAASSGPCIAALATLAWQLRPRDRACAAALIKSREALLAPEPLTPESTQVLRGRIRIATTV